MPRDAYPSHRSHALNRLSAVKVAKLKLPGMHEDGGGLRLVVTDAGVKRWILRVSINGRRVARGLGVWPGVSLEDARRKAVEHRTAAREGRDAAAEHRRAIAAKRVTFADAFEAFFDVRRQRLSNGKHVQQWQNTMRDYVFPKIGNCPVAEISAAQIIDVLSPIWFSKPETARRVLQRISATFDSAILRGTREKANPCIGVSQELGTGHRKVAHHPAVSWRGVPDFVRLLRASPASTATRLAFEFLVLTACRSGEARGARWSEVDFSSETWTIPGSDPATGRRMKTGESHSVPLSKQAIALLGQARKLGAGDLVFPGSNGTMLSDNTLSKLMRSGAVSGTPHGFRSAFKDWAAEHGVRDEVSEAALAHADRNKVRSAYRRTRFLDERRIVMQQWADFVVGRK